MVCVSWLMTGCSGPGSNSETTASDSSAGHKATLRVLFAGSLIIPFAQLEKEFEAGHPTIDVNMEGHGSIQAVRIVGDLDESADLVITADYRLVPLLLYAANNPDTGLPYASWNVVFATNKMVLAYAPHSRFADEVDEQNWPDVIARPGVRVGCSDPRLDANGYRALMTVKLAERVYGRPTLFADIFGGIFRIPIRVSRNGDSDLISVPEVLETKSGSDLVLRPYSVSLLPLLKSGDIDYAFEYESVARQHGLNYLALPAEINLGDTAREEDYAAVTVKLDFQRFTSVKPEFAGEIIRYSATIPSNSSEPEAAAELLAFLLGPEGQRVMAENFQPMIVPVVADNLEAVPEAVKMYCAED